jgi:peptide/nickel transport system permease protein
VIRFIAFRGLQAAVILLVVSFGVFLLLHLAPGDPARIALGPNASARTVAFKRHQLGLDRPILAQYWTFLSGLVRGRLGQSIALGASVTSLVGPRLATSMLLIFYTSVLTLLVTVPLGVFAATRPGGMRDHGIRLGAMVAFATPPFLVGILLILGFSLKLPIFPSSGYGQGFAGHLESLTLPAITMVLFLAPILIRALRSSLLHTLDADFVEATRARGFSDARILYRHVLRNSLMSTITLLGTMAGFLFSQTVVVENLFSIPGMGSELVSSVTQRDFPVIQALTVIFAILVVGANLLADVAYRLADPRVRL